MTAICLSCAKVTSISQNGFWLQCGDEELYLPFAEFPCFEHATIAQICHVHSAGASLCWPDLHLDFTLDVIRYPMALPHAALRRGC